jgi:hypothetical protein
MAQNFFRKESKMAKFNKTSPQAPTKTVNLAGGEAYRESAKLELVSLILTSTLQDKCYESASEQQKRLVKIISELPDKKFAAKAAVYARNVFGMRSITHVAAGEVAKHVKGQVWTKKFFKDIVRRPDDMLEILGYYTSTYGWKGVPNSMKKGFAQALSGMNEYQLAKYKGGTKEIKMVDLVNLVHPKATDALTKLMKGELAPAETWETQLSEAGKTDDVENAKKEVWIKLLTEKKLGYLALIRNLRNIIKQAPEAIPLAVAALKNEEAIKKSLVFPFQIEKAFEEIKNGEHKDRKILEALDEAVDISLSNCPTFDGKTLVVVDSSGSMKGQPITLASIFASVLYKKNDADFMIFSDSATYLTLNGRNSVLSIRDEIKSKLKSGGTNFHAIFQKANKAYDRIFILSDM